MDLSLHNGLWPVMLTPFTANNCVDYYGLESLSEWYIKHGSNGLFAVCQSSEMTELSINERIAIAKTVTKIAHAHKIQVIASGHLEYDPDAQVDEMKKMFDTGIDACVLITGRIVRQNESDDIFKQRIEYLLTKTPRLAYGLYECPVPYNRQLGVELIKWLTETGRFYFLKDTSCDLDKIKSKLNMTKGSRFKIFNAHTTTLLESMKFGSAGFSGIMANYHPQLYAKLIRYFNEGNSRTEELNAALVVLGELRTNYPIATKYYMGLDGVKIQHYSRSSTNALSKDDCYQMQKLYELTKAIDKAFG